MALLNCPECKKEISSEAETCPHCGFSSKNAMVHAAKHKEAKETANRNKGCAIGCLSVIGLIVIIGVIKSISPAQKKPETTESINEKNERVAAVGCGDTTVVLKLAEEQVRNYCKIPFSVATIDRYCFVQPNTPEINDTNSDTTTRTKTFSSDTCYFDNKFTFDNDKRSYVCYLMHPKQDVNFQLLSVWREGTGLNSDKYYYKNNAFWPTVKSLEWFFASKEGERAGAARAARKEIISRHFSSWDGSHDGLTAYIKEHMNDPGSFKHVETRYTDHGDYLTVTTQYRGKNAFGAIVLNEITAKISLDGTVLEIIDTDE